MEPGPKRFVHILAYLVLVVQPALVRVARQIDDDVVGQVTSLVTLDGAIWQAAHHPAPEERGENVLAIHP